ncbi:hypothetical protein, partial [Bosea sp. LC85]|uniref:hypothetical protein n=1 Tax=Bosea sp. LC85 TaxID=1502851 RepID=UPI001AEBE98E
ENNDPVRSSPPRIQINPVAATPRNHHTNQKASAFFSSLLEAFSSEVDTGSREENAIKQRASIFAIRRNTEML